MRAFDDCSTDLVVICCNKLVVVLPVGRVLV